MALTDTSVAPSLTGSGSLQVQSGPIAQFALIDGSGNLADSGQSVAANTPIKLTLQPQDNSRNAAVAAANCVVGLQSNSTDSYSFRTSAGGVKRTLLPYRPARAGPPSTTLTLQRTRKTLTLLAGSRTRRAR